MTDISGWSCRQLGILPHKQCGENTECDCEEGCQKRKKAWRQEEWPELGRRHDVVLTDRAQMYVEICRIPLLCEMVKRHESENREDVWRG